LTDPVKFENFKKYGNPDGSVAIRAVAVALPTFFYKEEYQVWVLSAFFILVICCPLIMTYQYLNKKDLFFHNGLLNKNRTAIIEKVAEICEL